jgi:hypothetical protein
MLNLYEILKEVLNESVSSDSVNDAINNKYRILINYDDEDNHATGTRLVEPYVLGYTRAGNLAFRGYQYEGDTVRGVPKWKLFRLDRVINWQPTKQKFNVEPKDNGWSAEPYNYNGDGSLTSILNQVSFDNKEELFSPNDRLNTLRKKTDILKNSTPINISQMQNQPKPNNSGPIANNVTNSVSNQNAPDFQKMLDRNLELTRKEKAKRGFSLSNNGVKRGPIDAQQNTSNIDNTETTPEIVNQQDNNNNVENNKSDFQKMLDRNLDLTRKEKAKRGFSLSDKNIENGKRR